MSSPAPAPHAVTGHDTRWAWLSLAATVLTLPLGIALAGAIFARAGFSVDAPEAAPLWVAAVAGLSALVVILTPAAVAVLLGRRAVRRGDPSGRVPMLIAGMGGLLFAALNLAQLLLRALGL